MGMAKDCTCVINIECVGVFVCACVRIGTDGDEPPREVVFCLMSC